MPIYSYRCENCGHRQDVLQKMSDPLLVTCPACGEATYRKQLTAAGFQLKGSGWYVTDFKNPPAKEAAKAVKADADAPAAKDAAPAAEPSPAASETPASKPASATESKSDAPAPKAPPATDSA